MKINLRGGLGNQIIQIAYIMKNNTKSEVNINAVQLREQLKEISNLIYFNSIFLNYFLGIIRKIISIFNSKATDITLFNVHDGYFQYGDITNLIPIEIKEHLKKKIYFDPEIIHDIDIAIHIRGGDYFDKSAQEVYEVCDQKYYWNALRLAENLLNKSNINIYIVTNDKKYASELLNKMPYNKNFNFIYYYKSEWSDFSLINRAKIAIIPNSTFSMMARMINDEGETFAPKKWFTKKSNLDAPYNSNFTYV